MYSSIISRQIHFVAVLVYVFLNYLISDWLRHSFSIWIFQVSYFIFTWSLLPSTHSSINIYYIYLITIVVNVFYNSIPWSLFYSRYSSIILSHSLEHNCSVCFLQLSHSRNFNLYVVSLFYITFTWFNFNLYILHYLISHSLDHNFYLYILPLSHLTFPWSQF